MALVIMALDVGANSYALFGLGIPSFSFPLLMQAAFFGFVLGSIVFLWPRSDAVANRYGDGS